VNVPRILHRYVFREILVPFAFGLSVFTFILLIARLLKLIELVVTRGVPVMNILRLLTYIMPAFLEVTVPMAMLLAILVAFGRLSADSEMVALRSSGLSLYQLVPPVAIVVALATAATAALALHARPWGNRSLRSALFEIARSRATAGIKPQVFNDDFPGLVIYTEGVDSTADRLRHVLISDERDSVQQNRIFAREGVMMSDPATQAITLRLRDGFIHTTDGRAGTEYQTHFEFYDVNLDLRQMIAGARQRDRDPKELTLGQLRRAIAAKRAAGVSFVPELVEYHRKFSIPFACVVFGLAAVPLGVQPVRAARSRGFTVSLAMIFLYYILLSIGQALAEHELVPAAVGLWLPNVVFAVLGSYLFVLAARERTLAQLERLQEGIAVLRGKLLGWLTAEARP
jgi:lipopolysaccharide export system permease protein